MASDTTDYPGIVYCPPNSRSVGEIIRSLILIYEVYAPEEMIGRIEYIWHDYKAIALSENKGDRTLKKQQLRYTQNIMKLLWGIALQASNRCHRCQSVF